MDVERYREVDAKIGRIHWVQRSSDGRQVTFRFTPDSAPCWRCCAPPSRSPGTVSGRW